MHPPAMPPRAPQAPPGFMRRHWRWLLALGLMVVFGVVAALAWWGVSRWSRAAHESPPMREAMRRAGCSVELVAALGEPLRSDRVPHGSMSVHSSGRRAVGLAVGVHGPHGSARLYVRGNHAQGRWDYPVMYVLLDDEQTLDLSALDDAAAARRCELDACRQRGDCPLPEQPEAAQGSLAV